MTNINSGAGPNVIDDYMSNGSLYDKILLKGVQSPGLVRLSGHDLNAEFDVRKGPGLRGASTNLRSIPPIEFTATFTLVREDFGPWAQFEILLQSTIGNPVNALPVFHPDLASRGVIMVALKSLGGLVYDGVGGATCVVKMIQYRAPQKMTALALSGTPPRDPAILAREATVRALTQKFADTPWG